MEPLKHGQHFESPGEEIPEQRRLDLDTTILRYGSNY